MSNGWSRSACRNRKTGPQGRSAYRFRKTGMYRARVRAMAAAHRYISPLTIPSGRRGKSRKMNRTTYKRAVQHFPNHGAILLCLLSRYPLILLMLVLYVIKEGFMLVMGILKLRQGKKLNGAKWFGK